MSELVNTIMAGMPESWDGSEAAEQLVVDYVRELERRLIALGGSLERYPEDADGAPLPDAGESPRAYAAAVRRLAYENQQVPVRVTAVEIINGVEVPIGEPRERTTSRGALDLLHGESRYPSEDGYNHAAAELADRRQRAREAFYDGSNSTDVHPMDLDAAIETATRVRITPEIIEAGLLAAGAARDEPVRYANAIAAAFEAAGFEVEQ